MKCEHNGEKELKSLSVKDLHTSGCDKSIFLFRFSAVKDALPVIS